MDAKEVSGSSFLAKDSKEPAHHLAQGDLEGLLSKCTMYEFQEGLEESNVGIFRAYRYGMLTKLILNDVVGAQLVWKRVLEQKKKPLVRANALGTGKIRER